MATATARDTGIIALVPVGDLPLPRKGGARTGGILARPGKIAIHAGESETDALAFADALRASRAAYLATAFSLGAPTGKDATGIPGRKADGTADVRAIVSKRGSGLVPHTCAGEDEVHHVRVKYLGEGSGYGRPTCPKCAPDRSPVRPQGAYAGPCVDCGATVAHPSFRAFGSDTEAHPYQAPPVLRVPELRILDVPRIIPADLHSPIVWRDPAPQPARPEPPAPQPPAPRKAAARKAQPPARKAARVVAPVPSPAPVAPATAPVAPDTLGPCPRCARTDWQTAKGRDWHVANNPECTRWVDTRKHAYAA
jgi:hypothetical protein